MVIPSLIEMNIQSSLLCKIKTFFKNDCDSIKNDIYHIFSCISRPFKTKFVA